MNTAKIVGNNIKQARKAKGLTQKELAYKIGIKTQSYQAYESNISLPTVENLLKLCIVLGVSLNELFDFE